MGSSVETGDDDGAGWPNGEPGSGIGAGGVIPSAGLGASVPLALAAAPSIDISALIEGHRWQGPSGTDGRVVITYSFVAGPSAGDGLFSATGQALSASDRALVRQTLDRIEHVSAIRFTEVPEAPGSHGTLRFGYSQEPNDLGYAGYTFYPSASAQAGSVWLGQQQSGTAWDFYRPNLILHETLHALGLKHPFEGTSVMATADDVIANTVMSYSPLPGYSIGALSAYPAEPMPADVAALQAIYGAPAYNAGDTVYRLDAREWRDGFHVIYDSGGSDILDASGLSAGVTLNLNAGARSDIGVQVAALARQGSGTQVSATYRDTLAIAQGTTIEHAIGTAFNDVLLGNASENWLMGGGGNDRIEGGAGVDTALYAGPRAEYQLVVRGQQLWVYDLANGAADSLQDVERAMFSDVTIDLTLAGLPMTGAGWQVTA